MLLARTPPDKCLFPSLCSPTFVMHGMGPMERLSGVLKPVCCCPGQVGVCLDVIRKTGEMGRTQWQEWGGVERKGS